MKKILVIEDALSLRRDIIEMLEFEGYDVAGAEDGLTGVTRAREMIPDLIICDIMMPALDGYGVLERLRQDPATTAIPFIFLTARTDRGDVRQGMELGADDYLTKPFTASELLGTVNARLKKKEIEDRKVKQIRENIILSLPHELRTPLNVILGFSDLLMSDYEVMEPASMGEMAQHINNAALRLYRLVENFLIYANIELLKTSAEQMAALRESRTENPRAAIEIIVHDKAQTAGREEDIDLDVTDVPAIRVAEDYLRKMLEELIDNAFKFSNPGSRVLVAGRPDDDQYVLEISDQGRGMNAEQIANIGAYMQFDRGFYEQQGSGLGLTIAKRLAELHDGALSVYSEPGEGTTIRVALPQREFVTSS